MSSKSTFAKRLEKLRENKGWTKTELASYLKASTLSTYANWEYGTREPDFQMLVRIANLFDVSTDYLLGLTNLKARKEVIEENELRRTFKDIEVKNWVKEISEEDLKTLKEIWKLIKTKEDK